MRCRLGFLHNFAREMRANRVEVAQQNTLAPFACLSLVMNDFLNEILFPAADIYQTKGWLSIESRGG